MFKVRNKLLIFSILGMFLFYFFFAVYSNIELVAKSLASMKMEFLPTILLFTSIGVLVKGIRQHNLLKFSNIKISFKENMIIYISGLSLIVAPGGIGAMIKTKFFKDKHGISIKNTVPIIMMETYHEFLGWVTVIAITILIYNSIEAKLALLFGSIMLIIIYVNLRYKKILQIFKQLFIKIKPFQKIIEGGEDSQKSLYTLTSASKMLITWIFTIISLIFELFAIYLIFLAFDIHQFNFILVSQVAYTSLLFGYIVFLPNGIGITDGSFIGMLVIRKLDLALATSVVLAVRFIGLWFKITIGFIALKFLHIQKNDEL